MDEKTPILPNEPRQNAGGLGASQVAAYEANAEPQARQIPYATDGVRYYTKEEYWDLVFSRKNPAWRKILRIFYLMGGVIFGIVLLSIGGGTECDYQPAIKAWIMVLGAVILSAKIINVWEPAIMHLFCDSSTDIRMRFMTYFVFRIFQAVCFVFLLAWSAAGGYWVFGFFQRFTNNCNLDSDDTCQCEPGLYWISFGVVIFVYFAYFLYFVYYVYKWLFTEYRLVLYLILGKLNFLACLPQALILHLTMQSSS